MIDLRARERILQERRQKDLIGSLSERLKPPPEKPDTMTAPLEKVSETSQENLNVATFLLKTVHSILQVFEQVAQQAPSASDVQDVKTAVEGLKFPEQKEQVTLNPQQKEEIVTAIKGITFPEIPKEVTVGNIEKITTQLAALPSAIAASFKKVWPTTIEGRVEVTKMPSISLPDVVEAISELRKDILIQKQEKKPVVKEKPIDLTPLTTLLTEVSNKLDILAEKEQPFPESMAVQVENFPPQMVPTPVTHFSINALQGTIKTTQTTVTHTLTPLPSYGQLINRRALQVYNNSSTTIYVGGSDVTTSNGIPVPAGSFSPILDAGYNVILYGVTVSGSADARIMEISDEGSGR